MATVFTEAKSTVPSLRFFRLAALAAAGSVVMMLVAQLALVDFSVPSGHDALGVLYLDRTFRTQGALILGQVMLMFVALLGVAAGGYGRSAGLMVLAAAFVVLWQVLELIPRSIDVFAASGVWAESWRAASTDAERAQWLLALELWQGAWHGLGMMRRIVWGATHLLFGLVFVRHEGLGRWLGVLFLLNAVRLLPRTGGALLGVPWLAELGAGRWWFMAGMIPLFALASVWLWREGDARARDGRGPEGSTAETTTI